MSELVAGATIEASAVEVPAAPAAPVGGPPVAATEPAAPAGKAGPKAFPVVDADAIRHAFETGTYPYSQKMGIRAYEAEKAKLQAELLKVQIWAQETGQKFIILFEGRDAAGKGGTIKRFISGKGNADKQAVVSAVRARGFNPADDNEADALAILLWTMETQGGVR